MATRQKKYKESFFGGGFIKMPRHLLTMPCFEDMYEKESIYGGWFYIIINLELSNASSHWLLLTGKLLDRFAKEIHKSRTYVRHLITDYPDLYIVDGNHFTTHWMVEQFSMKDVPSIEHKGTSPARTYYTHAEDIDKDVKKENKEKGIVRVSDDTHQPSSSSPPPAPSNEEEESDTNYNKYNHYFKR